MNELPRCEFTGGECDKGMVYESGLVGCGFYDLERDQCSWLDDVPHGMPPRMFYNDLLIQAINQLKDK